MAITGSWVLTEIECLPREPRASLCATDWGIVIIINGMKCYLVESARLLDSTLITLRWDAGELKKTRRAFTCHVTWIHCCPLNVIGASRSSFALCSAGHSDPLGGERSETQWLWEASTGPRPPALWTADVNHLRQNNWSNTLSGPEYSHDSGTIGNQ